MERRHEQEWARMAWEGDHTFQEVFSMTSLGRSVKLLPGAFLLVSPLPYGWHIGGHPVTGWNHPATPDVTKLRNHLLQGSQAVLLAYEKLYLLPYLFYWIFLLRASLPLGAHSLSPLLALCRRKGTALLADHLALIIAREPGLIPQRWRLGVNTALHGAMTRHLN